MWQSAGSPLPKLRQRGPAQRHLLRSLRYPLDRPTDHGEGAIHAVTCSAFEQAIEALGHLPEAPDIGVLAIELRLDMGDALMAMGEHERSHALLSEAEAVARRLDDRASLARVLAIMASIQRW
jgi:hypothetical protein